MRCISKIFVLACLLLTLRLGLSSIATAQVVVGQLADLSNNHPGVGAVDALANPINDTQDNPSWRVGWTILDFGTDDLDNGLQNSLYSFINTPPFEKGWNAEARGYPSIDVSRNGMPDIA